MSFSKDWSWQPVRIPGASNSAFEAQGYGSSAPTRQIHSVAYKYPVGKIINKRQWNKTNEWAQRKQKVLLMPLLPLLHTNAELPNDMCEYFCNASFIQRLITKEVTTSTIGFWHFEDC